MLQFAGVELRAVLSEAPANDCRIILVKDHGVYLMSEVGETDTDGGGKVLVYAISCNPDLDEFEQWWNVAISELGGDDFSEYLDVNDGLLTELLVTNRLWPIAACDNRAGICNSQSIMATDRAGHVQFNRYSDRLHASVGCWK